MIVFTNVFFQFCFLTLQTLLFLFMQKKKKQSNKINVPFMAVKCNMYTYSNVQKQQINEKEKNKRKLFLL